jgi:hypothetical protein
LSEKLDTDTPGVELPPVRSGVRLEGFSLESILPSPWAVVLRLQKV